MTYFLIFSAIIATAFFLFRIFNRRQQKKTLLTSRLQEAQRSIIAENVPLYKKLPTDLRNTLEGKINLFLDQIDFQGYEGLEVTEKMRLIIASQACMLVVNKNIWYKNLRTILVYPNAFKSQQVESDGYVHTVRETVRTGESWARGPVVLSWAHAKQGAFIDDDGHNVVLHEFAHQLDDLSGDTDGAPILDGDHNGSNWTQTFRKAYARLVDTVQKGHKSFLDPYGATAPAEFFAVAVEFFFEKPAALKQEEAALYEHLAAYFKLDPAEWKDH